MKKNLTLTLALLCATILHFSCTETQTTDTVEISNNDGVTATIEVQSDETNQKEVHMAEDTVYRAAVEDNCGCKDALKMVYNKINVRNDKEYLLKLHEIYNSTNQQQVDQKSGTGLGIKVPDFGTGLFDQNKEKVNRVMQKHSRTTDVTLDFEDHSTLSHVYTTENNIARQLESWEFCIANCNKVPTLRIIDTSNGQVVAALKLPVSEQNQGLRVKLRQIVKSPNLTIARSGLLNRPDVREGQWLHFGQEYQFVFKRTNYEAGFVSLVVDRVRDLQASFMKLGTEPVYEEQQIPGKLVVTAQIDTKKKTMTITDENGKKPPIRINPKSIVLTYKTNLAVDSSRLQDIAPVVTVGGIKRPIDGNKVEIGGFWYIKYAIVPDTRNLTVKFNINYAKSKMVCVKNCK